MVDPALRIQASHAACQPLFCVLPLSRVGLLLFPHEPHPPGPTKMAAAQATPNLPSAAAPKLRHGMSSSAAVRTRKARLAHQTPTGWTWRWLLDLAQQLASHLTHPHFQGVSEPTPLPHCEPTNATADHTQLPYCLAPLGSKAYHKSLNRLRGAPPPSRRGN